MYIQVHYNVYTWYPLCTGWIYIELHLHIHWGAHLYTFCCISCHTMYIVTCYPMYIHMLPNVYVNIHWVYTLGYRCIYIGLDAIYIVLHFFVTQCIYNDMLPNVYTSECTTMYIHNVYKMQHNVYQPIYIVCGVKKGVYTLGNSLYTLCCICIYIWGVDWVTWYLYTLWYTSNIHCVACLYTLGIYIVLHFFFGIYIV